MTTSIPSVPVSQSGEPAQSSVPGEDANRHKDFASRWRLALCLGLVSLADFLFYYHSIGWTAGGFGLCVLLIAALCNRRFLASRTGRFVFIVELGLIAALVEDPSPLALMLFSAGLVSFVLSDQPAVFRDVIGWGRALVLFAMQSLGRLPRDLWAGTMTLEARANGRPFDPVIRAWLLPSALAAVFAGLFWSANPVIEGWITAFGRSASFDLPSLERTLFWLGSAMVIWPVLYPRLQGFMPGDLFAGGRKLEAGDEPGTPAGWDYLVSMDAVVRSMVIFNVLFAIENGLDLAYLWAGSALPQGVTYASYAQRGAYPLIATALLAGAFVMLVFGPGSKAKHSRLVTGLMYLWIGQNVFLVVSSIARTLRYVEVYSLTYLRLAALIWMAVVAAGLIWLVLRFIWDKSNVWLLNANALSVLATLYGLSFVNPGGVIADYNVRHCSEIAGVAAHLDFQYLEEIGPDAYPALRWYIGNVKPTLLTFPTARAELLAHRFEAQIQTRVNDWRGWTLRLQRYAGLVPKPQAPAVP